MINLALCYSSRASLIAASKFLALYDSSTASLLQFHFKIPGPLLQFQKITSLSQAATLQKHNTNTQTDKPQTTTDKP